MLSLSPQQQQLWTRGSEAETGSRRSERGSSDTHTDTRERASRLEGSAGEVTLSLSPDPLGPSTAVSLESLLPPCLSTRLLLLLLLPSNSGYQVARASKCLLRFTRSS